jgi:nicotinate-nucleotide pyrophosphorylase (carboxylating)
MEKTPVDGIISLALAEDLCEEPYRGFFSLADGEMPAFSDVTTEAIFHDEQAEARVRAKSEGVLSGERVFTRVFEIVDPALSVSFAVHDGERFKGSDAVARLRGRIKSILIGERTALNFLGHLSGIATKTRRLVQVLNEPRIRILDTRKTLPGLRMLEKQAVLHGGGSNHRMGLYDMVLIKDNHIDGAGTITEAVRAVRNRHGDRYRIEVETRNLLEVEEAVSANVDRIMLDNMDISLIRKALRLIGGRAKVEVSGNIDEHNIARLRGLDIDFVSSGSLTYGATHADFSLTLQNAGVPTRKLSPTPRKGGQKTS